MKSFGVGRIFCCSLDGDLIVGGLLKIQNDVYSEKESFFQAAISTSTSSSFPGKSATNEQITDLTSSNKTTPSPVSCQFSKSNVLIRHNASSKESNSKLTPSSVQQSFSGLTKLLQAKEINQAIFGFSSSNSSNRSCVSLASSSSYRINDGMKISSTPVALAASVIPTSSGQQRKNYELGFCPQVKATQQSLLPLPSITMPNQSEVSAASSGKISNLKSLASTGTQSNHLSLTNFFTITESIVSVTKTAFGSPLVLTEHGNTLQDFPGTLTASSSTQQLNKVSESTTKCDMSSQVSRMCCPSVSCSETRNTEASISLSTSTKNTNRQNISRSSALLVASWQNPPCSQLSTQLPKFRTTKASWPTATPEETEIRDCDVTTTLTSSPVTYSCSSPGNSSQRSPISTNSLGVLSSSNVLFTSRLTGSTLRSVGSPKQLLKIMRISNRTVSNIPFQPHQSTFYEFDIAAVTQNE